MKAKTPTPAQSEIIEVLKANKDTLIEEKDKVFSIGKSIYLIADEKRIPIKYKTFQSMKDNDFIVCIKEEPSFKQYRLNPKFYTPENEEPKQDNQSESIESESLDSGEIDIEVKTLNFVSKINQWHGKEVLSLKSVNTWYENTNVKIKFNLVESDQEMLLSWIDYGGYLKFGVVMSKYTSFATDYIKKPFIHSLVETIESCDLRDKRETDLEQSFNSDWVGIAGLISYYGLLDIEKDIFGYFQSIFIYQHPHEYTENFIQKLCIDSRFSKTLSYFGKELSFIYDNNLRLYYEMPCFRIVCDFSKGILYKKIQVLYREINKERLKVFCKNEKERFNSYEIVCIPYPELNYKFLIEVNFSGLQNPEKQYAHICEWSETLYKLSLR